ncbi:MAG: hypothetical protein HDT47_04820 [Ruminococcaceae bacterium]|nr:hypothetical protein [Oscillospiraceae bacterium]
MFSSDIYIKGKHASWLKFLSEKTEKNDKSEKVAGVFKRDIDVYLTAAIVGLNYGLRRDADNNTDKAKIHIDTVHKEQNNLTFVFRIVMLVDNSTSLSADEKIERAFRKPDTPENMDLFNSYVRGGIEWLYEQFSEGATTKDDYLAKIYQIVDSYNSELIV